MWETSKGLWEVDKEERWKECWQKRKENVQSKEKEKSVSLAVCSAGGRCVTGIEILERRES